ncbi:hypothetical protein A1OO_04565 [Enterovibrio norvegicus FF-33]|uniref:hypothetical protein n=1 Tax=Enterovibrio norvegicus TaxID=188144 RepID=UPI00036FF3F3|nr:hypothetical protein [Enterovibrio norvegicus]OEE70052.1 hypothetical protein A1OO_04565 [Enterovibrio norvegicus FF-33]
MARLAPQLEVVRALFARSGNQCAFPGCTQPLVNTKNKFIGQICHIEAAMPNGERYNENQNDEDRRAYDNLLIMCYPHHIETNDIEEYTVERLTQIKFEHESVFEKSNFKIDESELYKLASEMEKYWKDIERLNTIDHTFEELALFIDAKSSFFEILCSARKAIEGIEGLLDRLEKSDKNLMADFNKLIQSKGIPPELFEDVPYYENPLVVRNWEDHNLARQNWLQRLRIYLAHIEVKYIEEYLKTNRNDLIAKNRLEKIKATLSSFAQNAVHVD